MKRLRRDSRLLTSILALPKTAVLAVFIFLLSISMVCPDAAANEDPANTTVNTSSVNTHNAAAVFTNSRGDVHSSAPADSSVATKNVLAYVEYADTSSSGEYQNTLSAISSVSSNYVVTQLTDYTQLASVLPVHDILLIPEQENGSSSQLQSIGTAWATTLQNFVNNGGVVIQCEYNKQYQIITGSGLMSITSSSRLDDQIVTVVAPDDPVAQGVPASYYARNGSAAYTTSEGRVVVERTGYGPVVIDKEMGLGNIVLIGHDYYESNASQDRIVGNAVFNLPSIRDDLIVTPWNELSSSGAEGGPFSPLSIDYTLTNSGSAPLDWTASKSAAWVDLSLSGGTLSPSESVTVTVSINATVNIFAHGTYTDTVTFTNTTSGVSRYRDVTLEVFQVATLPFFDDFESGVLASYWHSTGTYDYRTEVTSDYGPYSGSYHLIMDNGLNSGVYSRNELTLIIDLDGYEGAVLSFWMKEFNDEDHGPPPTPFIGGADFDGVAASEDGITWYEIQGLRSAQGVSGAYSQFIVDLDAATATYGLSYNSAFRIRFNHYDNYSISSNGFAFDDISVTADLRDDLRIEPRDDYGVSGAEGGPFNPAPKTYTLTNRGAASLNWTASKTAPWIDLAPSAGTLAPSESVTVTIYVNVTANSLSPGTYTDTVIFTNTGSGVSRQRDVTLNVYQVATLPFLEDFESGALVSYWHSTGTYNYRTQVESNYSPYSGSYHLIMDNGLDNYVYSRNELTLIIDLDGYEDAVLSFWMKEFHDEDHGPPPTPFIGGADFDGVAVSEDGITWYEIQGLRSAQGVSGAYSQFIVDLDAATATYGLSYNSAFRIRFNHYDNYGISTDGFAFDDISVTAGVRDDLRMQPGDDYRVSGAEGGPFNPASKTYTLTNRGAASLDWTASKTAPWIDLSPSAGTLTPSRSVAVTVSINANANSLAHGTYTDTVTFTNTTSGVSRHRDVTLGVFQVATLPFFDGFESGTLASYWHSTGTYDYRTQVTSNYYPHSGSYHLIMDNKLDSGVYSRNELTLRINLQGYKNVTLAFWMKEFDDEDEGPPPIPFIGGADFDGVAVSEDGITWYEVQGLRTAQGVSGTYSQFIVDLDAAIATYGLSYNSAFRIRFNHYGNYSISSDGFAFDDISVTRSLARYKFDTGDEGWVGAGQILPFDIPTTTSLDGHIGLNALGSADCFSYWQSPDIPIEDGRLYRARWTVQCDVSDPDDAVQFRLRVNQAGTWSAWDKVINSYLGHAPSAGNPKDYDVYFKPVVTGAGDNHAVFCFDIMSFAPYDDTNCWLYLEELRVDEVAASLDREILRYDFTYGGEGWIFEGLIWPFDRPQAMIVPGRIGISPNGSANSFSYWWSPDVLLENNKLYRVRWDVESDVANPDDAVQFRVRANQTGAWSAWNRNVSSFLEASPSAGNPKRYDIFLNPVVTGAYDDQMVLFFDITSFDPTDDVTSWLYLDSVRVEEISVGP